LFNLEKILSDSKVPIPKCEKCNSTVKPDVVFFGERLPERFFSLADEDFEKCDLLIIIGTSLTVQPFAGLIDNVPLKTPRLLINKTKSGQNSEIARLLGISSGLDFDSEDNFRDVLLLEDCDKGCQQLAEALDWGQELKEMIEREHQIIDKNEQ
jgi:NAD-dependent deacetylase sirtuin 2